MGVTDVTVDSAPRTAVSTDRASVAAQVPVLPVVTVLPPAVRAPATAPVVGPVAATDMATVPVTAMAMAKVEVTGAVAVTGIVMAEVAGTGAVALTGTAVAEMAGAGTGPVPPRAAATGIRTATVRPRPSPCICARSSRRS
ncbi:hypothetical protein A4E84_19825 [Streptomyces qaidamensis]|uniref:Uncharacterized protein n=1 Tax=Streptomyces qaidamensis TaxID=1783515 RepID=A0A143C291_9ACTN|nr:hypothetical protein A4E84_19825 [Streptomyces qaidamensis]